MAQGRNHRRAHRRRPPTIPRPANRPHPRRHRPHRRQRRRTGRRPRRRPQPHRDTAHRRARRAGDPHQAVGGPPSQLRSRTATNLTRPRGRCTEVLLGDGYDTASHAYRSPGLDAHARRSAVQGQRDNGQQDRCKPGDGVSLSDMHAYDRPSVRGLGDNGVWVHLAPFRQAGHPPLLSPGQRGPSNPRCLPLSYGERGICVSHYRPILSPSHRIPAFPTTSTPQQYAHSARTPGPQAPPRTKNRVLYAPAHSQTTGLTGAGGWLRSVSNVPANLPKSRRGWSGTTTTLHHPPKTKIKVKFKVKFRVKTISGVGAAERAGYPGRHRPAPVLSRITDEGSRRERARPRCTLLRCRC